ncbi:MAG TPA: UDP-N-acetylmuramoyl-tripeptide--D-alanyl-D-alanine ligase [Candidatus Polarisedimenticolaceae bacterium]
MIEPLLERLASGRSGYTSDSRIATPHDVFVALKGGARDGHDFVPELLARGVACVVERGRAPASGAAPFVEVEDTHAAHRVLAALFRRRFRGRVVGIGGSSGKTTAKEFTASILAAAFRVAKTERSQNGELGVPRTLERLRTGVEVAVVEIGIDAPGDMARHVEIVAPDIAVLTSIGEEHLNLLGSVENVFREETILFDATLARGGVAFAPEDDPWLSRLEGRPGVTLVPSDPERLDPALACPLTHPYARRNAALACAVALHLGMPARAIAPVLATLDPPEGRGQERILAEGTVVLLDHYNANPSSLRAGLEAARLRAASASLPLRLVLGDMLDLGSETARAHEGMIEALRSAAAASLWLVGPEWSKLADRLAGAAGELRVFPDSAAAAREAEALRLPPAVVLVKGSRGMALERVLRGLGVGA